MLLRYLTSLLVILVPLCSAYTLTDNLISLYDLGGVGGDDAEDNYEMSVVGTLSSTETDFDGAMNGATSGFTATDYYQGSCYTIPEPGTSWTATAWVKITMMDEPHYSVIFNPFGTSDACSLQVWNEILTDGVALKRPDGSLFVATYPLVQDEWIFIAYVLDNDVDTDYLFASDVATVLTGALSTKTTTSDFSGGLCTGNSYIGISADTTKNFLGVIGEVAVWDRKLETSELEQVRLGSGALNDPHFVGIHRQFYDIHGTPEEIYNFYTSKSMQINTRFSRSIGDINSANTWFSEVGMKVRSQYAEDRFHVVLNVNDLTGRWDMSLNGKQITAVGTYRSNNCTVIVEPNALAIISTPEVSMKLSRQTILATNHMDISAELTNLGYLARPSGLWGQTWRKPVHDTPSSTSSEWPEFLLGELEDYHVAGSIWSDEFNFSAYQNE